ncbi:MAG: DNA mismatch repair protein MutS [Desulfosalsimonadaceae bacterium]
MGETREVLKTTPQKTPMMRQYLEIKEAYADCILFYRMGDFYEMFYEDAQVASRELEIALTTRNKNEPSPVPMCGVPVKAAEAYIGRLIEKGFRVAVCEQTENAAAAKGLVKREVVRVVTPGMVLNNELLDERSNNYILSVCHDGQYGGLSCLDLSTGTFRVTQTAGAELLVDESRRISPSEILLPASAKDNHRYKAFCDAFGDKNLQYVSDECFDYSSARRRITEQFRTRSLDGFGCEHLTAGVSAAGALLNYIEDTQKRKLSHIGRLETYSLENHLLIDDITCRNLELLAALQTGGRKNSLLDIMDMTITAMGGRLLLQWIRYPLLNEAAIAARQDAVEAMAVRGHERKGVRSALKGVFDLERLSGRIAMGQANARDLAALCRSIRQFPAMVSVLTDFEGLLHADGETFKPVYALAEEIEKAIVDDPPLTVTEGFMIRSGYDARLDELIEIARDGKSFIARIEAREKARTGINSLKVRYNKVFGYYIEVSKTHLSSVPEDFVRKQTLVNAERYITEELKDFETKVLTAQEQRAAIEYEIFQRLRSAVVEKNRFVQEAAAFIAQVDVVTALAELGEKNSYCRPDINTKGVIRIEEGRHPVVEKLTPGGRFVPNSIIMDNAENQVLIITGPNMAGKSTVLRQVALMVIMAQMGAFVPAASADICITDRIFTRVGALDNLSMGKSTFLVEMEETANIVNNASPDSLVIMDEIGRGTSTYDGLSIARAVAEYLHDLRGTGVKALFATHYHELTELEKTRPRVKNYNIAVKQVEDEIIFLHQLEKGATNKSYGIQVARLAGMPEAIINRARNVLAGIEAEGADKKNTVSKITSARERENYRQLSLFRLPEEVAAEQLMQIDVANMTPLEAINYLGMLQEKVKAVVDKQYSRQRRNN